MLQLQDCFFLPLASCAHFVAWRSCDTRRPYCTHQIKRIVGTRKDDTPARAKGATPGGGARVAADNLRHVAALSKLPLRARSVAFSCFLLGLSILSREYCNEPPPPRPAFRLAR